MPATTLDGQDLDAATDGLIDAVEAVRAGQGPRFVEMKTYRYSGHSRSDAAPYRDPMELERWLQRDPIDLLRARLIEEGELTEQRADELRHQVDRRLEDVIETTTDAPHPEPSAMFANIYA